MATKKEIDSLVKRATRLKSDRGLFESTWEDIAEFIYPQRQAFVSDPAVGQRFFKNIFDSTGIIANERLASALHGMLTNPASKWFALRMANKQLNEVDEVRRWLDTVENEMMAAINSPRANFASSMHEFYMEYSAFGTAIMFLGLNKDLSGLLFSARTLAECVLAEDSESKIKTVIREFKFSLDQVEDKWPGKMSEGFRKKFDKNPDEMVEIMHFVLPRTKFDPTKRNSKNLPIQSIYIEKTTKHELQDSGFNEDAYMAARFWKTSREIYGRSPGFNALAETSMLNEMRKTDLKSRQLLIMPPIVAESENVLSPIRLTPAGVTVIQPGTKGVAKLDIGGDAFVADKTLEQSRDMINRTFFSDQLQLGTGPQMTATEVLQRVEDKLRLLGPVLGRIQTEGLGPMIDRAFGLLNRGGAFPRPPDILLELGGEIVPEYVSPIARAQKAIEANGLLRMFDIVSVFLDKTPDAIDNLDADVTFREVGDLFGVPADFFKRPEVVAQIRQQRAQAQEEARQAELNKVDSETQKNVAVAEAPV
jgi:hypothetical protein